MSDLRFLGHDLIFVSTKPAAAQAAALSVADDQLKLPEVWAMAHPENHGSQRVLEKAGFIFAKALPDRTRLLYRRDR